jgi:hypothetical protein
MNPDQLLQRIFSLSRRSPLAKEKTDLPYGLETSVLAHWRDVRTHPTPNSFLLRGLGWAAIMACAIALLAGVLERDQVAALTQRDEPEVRLADSAIAVGYDYE